jgi:uroporphyrinogen-III decarboxylase
MISAGKQGIPENFSVQYAEKENIFFNDYRKIANLGWNKFCEEYFPRAMGISLAQLDAHQKAELAVYKEDTKTWDVMGVPVMTGALIISTEMTLSLGRTLPQFTLDLHRHPDVVLAALEAMVPDFIHNALDDVKASGLPWVNISLERGSGAYYNLKTYEKFFFPQLKKIVDALAEAGCVTVLHMDTDWTKNLPYLKELPKHKVICELDSTTNIFTAKDVLKGHMCIMGDVPAAMLTFGTPDEVVAYSEKLIDIVGKNGGFILSTGCECPVDAKFENMKALCDTAKVHAATYTR